MPSQYEIGSIAWFNGHPAQIISEPFALYGGSFQNARLPDGRVVALATPSQRTAYLESHQREWKDQQEAFARLHCKPRKP
jgi:hypothetical protein